MDAPAGQQAPPAPFIERRATPDGRRLRPPTPRVALLLVAAVIVGVVLYLGRTAVAPFVVGLLIVYLLDVPVERLSRRGVPRVAAVLLVYAAVVFILFEIVNLTVRPMIDQIREFVRDLPTLLDQLDAQLQRLGEIYRGLELPSDIRDAIDAWLEDLLENGPGTIDLDPGMIWPVFGIASGLLAAIFGYIVIPVWAFYILKDRPQLRAAFDRALPEAWRSDVWQVIGLVRRTFGQWVKAQLVLGLTVGVATFIGLLILGYFIDPVFSRFAILLAIIAGVFELLPIIGPILAAIPAILLALTAGPEAAIAAFLLYLGVQQVENNFLVPKIQGDAVELHPSLVIFALIIGGSIAGLLGAILAVPITAAARDVFRYLFRRLSVEPPSPAVAAAGIGDGSYVEEVERRMAAASDASDADDDAAIDGDAPAAASTTDPEAIAERSPDG